MLAEAIKVHGKPLAVLLSAVLWASASLAVFLLARQDWLILVVPPVGLLLLLVWPWGRSFWKSLLLIFLGLYGGLLSLEVGLRLYYFGQDALWQPQNYGPYAALIESGAVAPVDDPKQGFGLTPSYQGWFMGYPLTVNARGFRGPEWSAPKAPNTPRIIACGTSITMGAGVSEEDTYIAQLGALVAQKRGTPVEAFNAGVGAYSLTQSLRVAEVVSKEFSPDVVIVEVAPGALSDQGVIQAEVGKAAPLPISFVERFSFAASALYPPSSLRAKLSRFWSKPQNTPPQTQNTTNPIAHLEEQLTLLAKLGKEQGFSVVLLFVRSMTDFSVKPKDPNKERLEALAKTLGALVVKTEERFQATELPDQFIVFPGDLHPNAKAHARFAEALLEPVLGVLPPKR